MIKVNTDKIKAIVSTTGMWAMNNQQASEWLKGHYEDITRTCKGAGFESLPHLLRCLPIRLPERVVTPRGVYSEAEAAHELEAISDTELTSSN